MGLSLLSPWFLLGAVAVAVPIVLHLLARHTAPEVSFSATRFVPSSPVEQQRRRRLSDWLLLALRCLALVLLALAFARPYLASGAASATAPARLVALDTSFSMSAPGTWDAARQAAADAVTSAPAGTVVGVAAFDEVARVVSPLSLDRGAALAAIASLQPGRAGTDFGALSSPAAEWLAGRAGELVVVSDLQRGGLRGPLRLPAGSHLVVRGVAPARANLAVEQLSRDGSSLVAVLANHGLERRTTVMVLAIDDQEVARREVAVEEGASVEVRFDGAARARGIAVARIDDEAGLAADDTRYLMLDEPRPTAVWVVGSEADSFYVAHALTSAARLPRVEIRRVDWQQFVASGRDAPAGGAGAAAGGGSATVDAPHVVIVLTTRGMDAGARQRLGQLVTQGAGLLVAAGPEVDAGALSLALGEAGGVSIAQADAVPLPTRLAPSDVRHEIFAAYADRASAYAGVRFDRVVRVQPAEGDAVLATFTNGLPAVVERRVGRGRLMALASDLGGQWNQWPLAPTFLPWIHDTVTHLAARPVETGSFLVGETPAGVAAVPGAHTLADGRRIVVNVDPRESPIDLVTPGELEASVVEGPAVTGGAAAKAAAEESAQSWWWYLVAAMLLVLVVESAVGARRATA